LLCILSIWISLISTSGTVSSSIPIPDEIFDKVHKESIRSVQLHRTGWELTYPIIELNSPDQIHLSFDDLTDEIRHYSYTLIHCDAGWRPTGIPLEEYMEGFQENRFYNYALSFNTLVNFVHYTLDIPNQDVSLKISGNYILKVYEDFNEENIVFTKRFVVSERLISIQANVTRPVIQPFMDTGHEVDFSILYGNMRINDPYSEILVTICQNNRWDLAITDLKPLFLKDGVLDYNYQQENVFPGGNEYRYFEMKSLRFQSEYVKNIEYRPPHYHVELFPDKSRAGNVYLSREDINGKYFIDIQEGSQKDTEADYVYVHFSLLSDVPFIQGDVYIFGALTNWQITESGKLEYNFDKKAYECNLLLKQGYYNYEYVWVPENTRVADPAFFEGNHYETENDYVIYAYYRTSTSRYDRVVGYQIANSNR